MKRFLLVEDNPYDAYLLTRQIEDLQEPYVLATAPSLIDALDALQRETFDGILLDLTLPDTRGLEALDHIRTDYPHIAIAVVTGLKDADLAVKALKHGAVDYIVKDEITRAVLGHVLRYLVERMQLQQELLKRQEELDAAMSEVSTLKGLIRICASCKRVVNDNGNWEAIEKYVRSKSEAEFSHGLCPECFGVSMARLEEEREDESIR